jgi:zinc D-Ala-D-Ala carboxypeptidase
VLRGAGIVALVTTGGVSWAATTFDDLHVVEAAPPLDLAGDEGADPDAMTTSSTLVAAPAAPPAQVPAAPSCTSANELVQGDPTAGWDTVVVDRQRGLPPDYVPSDLAAATEAGFGSDDSGPGDKVRQIVVDDLAALRQAAATNDTPLVLVSGYRSYESQAQVFAEAVQKTGPQEADLTTAQPGHSEHQLGTTVDLLDTDSSELSAAFAETPAGRWLVANAHRYGFVMSYPDVPVERSCYGFEPWHLRYVGRDVAERIVESSLTPREWMLAHAEPSGSAAANEPPTSTSEPRTPSNQPEAPANRPTSAE